jgi:hypothetical protein
MSTLTKTSRQVNVKFTALASTENVIRNTLLIRGTLTGITVHWPDGCNALVEVGFGIDERELGRIFPNGTGFDARVALNNATQTWPLNIGVERGDRYWVEVFNYDGANPHTISVILTIELEKEEY